MDNCQRLAKNPAILTAFRRTTIFGMLVWVTVQLLVAAGFADEPLQIWAPERAGVGADECCFRKQFTLLHPEKGELELATWGDYKLSINGQIVGQGRALGMQETLDVSDYLKPGVNLIAVWVRCAEEGDPGLTVRLRVKENMESRWRVLLTGQTWKAHVKPKATWYSTTYNDMKWGNARILLGTPLVGSSDRSAEVSADSEGNSERMDAATEVEPPAEVESPFEIDPEFRVESVLSAKETGSLLAMEFSEFGKLLLSREGGPLLIADLAKSLGDPTRVQVVCDEVNSCQGILPLNGEVFVTAVVDGRLGLFRLADTNEDGMLEVTQTLVEFSGQPGEFGPHGIQLGQDGMIYVVLGAGSQVAAPMNPRSPYRHDYRGNPVPRDEVPGGPGAGIHDGGGSIIRVSLDGSKVETVAGGIRNARDLVLDSQGEWFVHDSEMESCRGMTSYRPSTVFHVPAGAELGWRGGWSTFSRFFVDQTPAVCEAGSGTPSGAVLYQHFGFPTRFHDTVFLADGVPGRILALRTQREGAGFTATTEAFLKGGPFNIVDLAVGLEGALYFCTGGNGKPGGVFRIVWDGEISDAEAELDSDLAKVIRHPQPNSAWARQSTAQLKLDIGESWGRLIEGVAKETRNSIRLRMRALNLMVLYGPLPSQELMSVLADDDADEIRAKIAQMCGMNETDLNEEILGRLVLDQDPRVRRHACESYMRLAVTPPLAGLMAMLDSDDRIEAASARRLLERIPAEAWESGVLATDHPGRFVQGSIALMVADPSLERAYRVLAKISQFMEGFVNDDDFMGMLRAMELALVQGNVDPSQVPGLAERVANEFPSHSSAMNQQLVRIMAYLGIAHLDGRIEAYLLDSSVPVEDKVQLGMYLQASGAKLSESERLAIVVVLEQARSAKELGGRTQLYLERAFDDATKALSPEQVKTVLKHVANGPTTR